MLNQKTTQSYDLHLNSEIPPLTAFPTTKDIRYHPLFRGEISRFLWRVLTLTVTRSGRWVLIATLLFMISGSITLDYKPYILFCYAFAIWVVAGIAAIGARPRVKIKATHADRITAGGVLAVDASVTTKGRAASDLTVLPHGLPPEIDAVPADGIRIPILAPNSKTNVHLGLLCKKRGIYRTKAYRVETDYPLGLLRTYRIDYDPQQILVYPNFHPLGSLALPSGSRYQPGGVAMASSIGESLELLGNREYKEGDNIRDIDWRATARLNIPIVREYREEYFLRVGVVLDTQIPEMLAPRIFSARQADFERAVSLAAAISDFMSRQDYLVDIFAAGPNLYHLTAGRSLAYVDQILEILACVDATPASPFETLEPEIAEHLAQITTIVCVLLDWDAARFDFVQRLSQSGSAVKVIVVRDAPCTDDPETGYAIAGEIRVVSAAEFLAGVEEL